MVIVAFFDIVPLKMQLDKWSWFYDQTPAKNHGPAMISPYTGSNL